MRIRLNKKIIVSVISDVVTDQRVQKECNTLYTIGYDVLVIGRKSKNIFMPEFPYKVIRFHNLFRRGPFMYLVFNLQLFFYLLFKKADVLWANDLDTLLPNFIVSRIKKVKLVYDSHEYFTLSVYKKASRKVWERLERYLFPKLKNVITVNDSIKNVYEEKYHVPVTVIRNVPYRASGEPTFSEPLFPAGKKILLVQGIGINENRGAEEAVLTMQYLPDDFNLYFIGSGTIINKLKKMVHKLKMEEKIFFIDVLPYEQMMRYTRQAYLGLIFEKIYFTDEHMFSLPNRFFDFIKAGVPVLSSKAVEIKALIDKYNIGDFIDTFDPRQIAEKIMALSKDPATYDLWKQHTKRAAEDLCWENEEIKLVHFMADLS